MASTQHSKKKGSASVFAIQLTRIQLIADKKNCQTQKK